MASFYGNIKNNSRSSFIFDRIYSSRCEMEKALYEVVDANGAIAGDGVFINRYVLINYGYSAQGYYTVVPNEIVQIEAGSDGNSERFGTYYRQIEGQEGYYPANYNLYTGAYDIVYNPSTIYYKKTNFVERFTADLKEEPNYTKNREEDAAKYYASFDHTVWQKIYSDNQEKYILVAELNPDAPTYELITDAPEAMGGAPHFDLSLSSELNYVYHVPKNWDIVLNEYNPNIIEEDIERKIAELIPTNFGSTEEYEEAKQNIQSHPEQLHSYWYYENDLLDKDKTFNIKEEYPFINKQGFNKGTRVIKPVQEEGFKLIETKSPMEYTIHQYRVTPLTIDTYTKNRYYIISKNTPPQLIDDIDTHIFDINYYYFIAKTENPTYYITCPLKIAEDGESYEPTLRAIIDNQESYWYIDKIDNAFELSLGNFDPTEHYYELTTIVDENNIRQRSHQKDTKRLDIFLPSIGNAIATMYDAIYGRPRYASRKIIGYTNDEHFTYEQNDFGAYEINASQYNLELTDVNELRIPVYNKDTGDFQGYITYEVFHNKFETNSSGHYMILGNIYDLKPVYENDNIEFNNGDESWNIPVYELIDNIIGYTTEGIIPEYVQTEDGAYVIDGSFYNLTEDDIGQLSPELIPGTYDVPVYAKENINARPYDDDKLFGTFAPPYDNINEDDNVSMGWALDTLKKYISELRYLANGQNGSLGNSLGLQSDWTLDDDQSFGYIYHKPDIITSFIPSADQQFIIGKTYYQKKIDNDSQSNNFGYEYYEEVSADISVDEEDTPSSLGYYEIPKTMAKNAETEFYREEKVVGFVSSSDINLLNQNQLLEVYQDKYFQQITDADNLDDPEIIYYKKVEDTFVPKEETDESSTIYYKEITDQNRIFIINDRYYFITNEQINNMQKYSDNKKKYEVIKNNNSIEFIPNESYYISNGSRYVPAYKTIGTYSFQPITQEQYSEKCLCYFDRFQEIKVINNEIVSRKYRFNSAGDSNNIYLTTGDFHNGGSSDLDNRTEFNNKRIKTFYIVINEDSELEMTNDFAILSIENMSRQQLIEYLLDNDLTHVELPEATYEINTVYDEEYQIYKNRNNNPFDFNQYVVSIKQEPLDEDYWSRNRNKGVVYYLRDYKPITQIDYEINTIWNSIKVDG